MFANKVNRILPHSTTYVKSITKPRNTINEITMVLITMWMIWPFFNYQVGVAPLALLLVIWLLTIDTRWIVQKWSLDLIFMVVWFCTFIPYWLTGQFKYGAMDPRPVQITLIIFSVGIFFNHYYMYYRKDYQTLGRIAFLSLLMFFIGSFQTYSGLDKFPLAARLLATGSDPMAASFQALGIGGFGFVYSAVFVGILVSYFLFSQSTNGHLHHKLLASAVLVMICLMIFRASYTIAVMALVFGLLSVLLVRGRKSLLAMMIISVSFLLFVPTKLIGSFLMNIAHLFEGNETLFIKLNDFAQGFLGNGVGEQTAYRSELYLVSFRTFLENPLFGIYGPFGNEFNALVGQHSGWLDLMAYYGLFGSIPLLIGIIFNFRKHLRFYAHRSYYSFLFIAQVLFCVFGFINPIVNIYQMGFVLFVVAPSIPFLPYAFMRRNAIRRIS